MAPAATESDAFAGLAAYTDLQNVTARTGIAYSTLRGYIDDGRLPAFHVGHRIRVKISDVEKLFIPIQPKEGK